jgi:hypothetical protein
VLRGNTLRIVAETVSVGKRVIVVRCEVSTCPTTFGLERLTDF